jgi:hypothetical protein
MVTSIHARTRVRGLIAAAVVTFGLLTAGLAAASPAMAGQSVFVRPTGEADVVAQGADDSLWYYWATPGSTWHSGRIAPAGSITSAPSIYVRSTGEADVVASGVGDELLYYYATPGSSWNSTRIPSPTSTISLSIGHGQFTVTGAGFAPGTTVEVDWIYGCAGGDYDGGPDYYLVAPDGTFGATIPSNFSGCSLNVEALDADSGQDASAGVILGG